MSTNESQMKHVLFAVSLLVLFVGRYLSYPISLLFLIPGLGLSLYVVYYLNYFGKKNDTRFIKMGHFIFLLFMVVDYLPEPYHSILVGIGMVMFVFVCWSNYVREN